MTQATRGTSKSYIELADHFGTHNYHPLPVVLSKGRGEWVWDPEGNRYLDMLSSYSAVNQGHCHPDMIAAMVEQANRITLTSRAFHNDQLGFWLEELTALCGLPKAIPMNSGAEAVETAIKICRKWAYLNKGIPENKAEIIVCQNNFHGRTTTIVGFSSEKQYKEHFGPFSPGFVEVPFGHAKELQDAITPNTAGILIEPIQGEAGVIVPPPGYLAALRSISTQHKVCLMIDEIQTGLARTGKLFAHYYEDCRPDLLILGKALGGGFYPISAVVGDREYMDVLKPGDHGSTFGGNPLACALSRAALNIIQKEKLAQKAMSLGEMFREGLRQLPAHMVKDVRGKGLLNALELRPEVGTGRFYSELLMKHGILAKDTHGSTIRFAPPLVITEESLQWALDIIGKVFSKTQDQWQ